MAKPTLGGWRRLKTLAKYLRGRLRVVQRYPWQEEVGKVVGYSDSD